MRKVIFALATGLLPALPLQAMEAQMKHSMHSGYFYGVQVEELEYRAGDRGEELGYWSADAFYGTDDLKLRWITEGEYDFQEEVYETLENQLALQVPVSTFFDAKAGLRFDTPDGQNRQYAFVGLAGLAPYWFELDSNLYVSDRGDVSVDLDAEYEILLSNRLILTPSAELDAAFSDDEEVGVGAGLSSMELGLRLSYDLIDRSVSPYVGVVYERSFGRTADFAAEHGEADQAWFAVVGVRLMF